MWFNPAEITKPAGAPIATSATSATLQPEINKEPEKVAEVAEVATVNVATEADVKPETLQDRQREARRQKVIAMLEAAPGTQRAVYTDTESDLHNVILAVAVRSCQQTCELLIPKAKYDPWRLLELVERHGQTTH